jgi:RNA-directed DNA polymerase
MVPSWLRRRGYRHFDSPVGEGFVPRATDAKFVADHSWSPLISYTKRVKRYKPALHKTKFKDRAIMYASHRDACIISYYADQLSRKLEEVYRDAGLCESVIAYRKLGKSNYHFAGDALTYVRAHAPCVVKCFDVTGFFDNLDHRLLKQALVKIFGFEELPPDWYVVFRNVTAYHHVTLASLKADANFAERLKVRSREPLATIAEVKAAGVAIERNPNRFGIPQGTPISAALSNLYMLKLDQALNAACVKHGAFYQRYSDDILIACSPAAEAPLTSILVEALRELKLELKDEKTERAMFDPASPEKFQYLGFDMSPAGATLRSASLARQWRKARRSIRRTRKRGRDAIAKGKAEKIYTQKLRKRFLPAGVRNFSRYARSSARALGSKSILRQTRRLERMVEAEIADFD